jgi:hypothetical protein
MAVKGLADDIRKMGLYPIKAQSAEAGKLIYDLIKSIVKH